MSREQLATRLADAGARRRDAMDAKHNASAEIAELIPRAYRAGIGVTEMTRLTGMSARAVYDVLHASGETPTG